MRLPSCAVAHNLRDFLIDLPVLGADVLFLLNQRVEHFKVTLEYMLGNSRRLFLSEGRNFTFKERAIIVPDVTSLNDRLTHFESQILSHG